MFSSCGKGFLKVHLNDLFSSSIKLQIYDIKNIEPNIVYLIMGKLPVLFELFMCFLEEIGLLM